MLPLAADYWERAEFARPLTERLGELGLVGDGIEVRLPAAEPDGRGPDPHGAAPRRRQPGHLPRRPGRPRDALHRPAGLAGPEAALAPPDGPRRALGAFALTEPAHGSDSVALESTARREGDTWILDGTKKWIGNGSIADIVVVWARDVADGQVKAFLVEPPAPGYAATRIDRKGSLRSVWQAQIRLDAVRVPEANRPPGVRTFKDAGRVLAATRNAVAWAALGHATAGYDIALEYCLHRTQLGKRLVAFQMVQDRLVTMLAEVCSLQLYCLRLARLQEEGQLTDIIAALAKMNNTRRAREVLATARDLLGGSGILLDHHVIRHRNDMEAIHIYEGTESIQTLIVGRDITGVGAFA